MTSFMHHSAGLHHNHRALLVVLAGLAVVVTLFFAATVGDRPAPSSPVAPPQATSEWISQIHGN